MNVWESSCMFILLAALRIKHTIHLWLLAGFAKGPVTSTGFATVSFSGPRAWQPCIGGCPQPAGMLALAHCPQPGTARRAPGQPPGAERDRQQQASSPCHWNLPLQWGSKEHEFHDGKLSGGMWPCGAPPSVAR